MYSKETLDKINKECGLEIKIMFEKLNTLEEKLNILKDSIQTVEKKMEASKPFILLSLEHVNYYMSLSDTITQLRLLHSNIESKIDKIKIEIISKVDESNLSEIDRIFNLNDNLSFTNIRKKNKLVENTNE